MTEFEEALLLLGLIRNYKNYVNNSYLKLKKS